MNLIDVLNSLSLSDNIVKLPDVQLDRSLYLEVKKALEGIGGKWKGGKTQGFVFQSDPSVHLEKMQSGQRINLKKQFQYFPTPDWLADEMSIALGVEPHHRVLEPSAGDGQLIKAVHRLHPEIIVDYFELMPENLDKLILIPNTRMLGTDFLGEAATQPYLRSYDRIIANPPFTRGADIAHTTKMFDMLDGGGRLVVLTSTAWLNGSYYTHREFKNLVEAHCIGKKPFDSAFKDAGTNITVTMLIFEKL